jgi:hypothetical protein
LFIIYKKLVKREVLMATISVTLEWDGVWKIEENDISTGIPDSEGIYMILCGKRSSEPGKWDTSSYKLLYIGEADKVRSRISGHEKWKCWNRNCDNHVLLKVAKCSLGTSKRQKVECCLIYKTKPVCNDECKDDFPYSGDTIEITNKEMHSPLNSYYSCR